MSRKRDRVRLRIENHEHKSSGIRLIRRLKLKRPNIKRDRYLINRDGKVHLEPTRYYRRKGWTKKSLGEGSGRVWYVENIGNVHQVQVDWDIRGGFDKEQEYNVNIDFKKPGNVLLQTRRNKRPYDILFRMRLNSMKVIYDIEGSNRIKND